MPQKSLLLQRIRDKARVRRLSLRTERVYVGWIRRFIRYHGMRHPRELSEREVSEFLTYLAAERGVAASTQTQALCALLFLYEAVLERPLARLQDLTWARPRSRVPVVLTPGEVQGVLRELQGTPRLVATLLYGSGIRLLECLRLRVKDVDLERHEIRVRDTKGGRARVTVLPAPVKLVTVLLLTSCAVTMMLKLVPATCEAMAPPLVLVTAKWCRPPALTRLEYGPPPIVVLLSLIVKLSVPVLDGVYVAV